ncbi:MAG: RNA polymerase sigma factor [Bacteroidia bacterium]
MKITDDELISGCKAGKRDLQKALYMRFSAKMLGICLRYTRNREEAEDVLQDGFVKVFQHLPQYAFAGSFEGWIRKIMVNAALEHLRKRKIVFAQSDIQNLEDDCLLDADVISKMGVQDLLGIIRELSPGYQVVFNLYAIEGFSHKEIAAMLDISEGTSKSQLARARKILQDKINTGKMKPVP